MDYLLQYDWPGNVRELRNLIERSLILGALNVSALYHRRRHSRPPTRRRRRPTDLHDAGKAPHPGRARFGATATRRAPRSCSGISRRTLERPLRRVGAPS